MKIAIITSGFLPVVDGVTVSGFSRLQKLSQWGHQVLLFCPDYSSLEAVYPNWQDYTGHILPGVSVVNLPSTAFFVDFERNVSIRAYKILLEELEQFKPDIIHVDEPERLFVGFWRVPGVKYAKGAQIPCVSFFRTNFTEYIEDFFPLPKGAIAPIKLAIQKLIVAVYNAYDVTLVSSRVTHKKLIDLGIRNTRYANLLGFDWEKFQQVSRQKDFFAQNYRLPEVDKKIKLVFVGRLTPDKGWDFTIKALARVTEVINPNQIAVLVAGDGEMRQEIATKLGKLIPDVHLLGRVSPDDVPALLANSDIHVTTSEKETRGLTILEAFAAGIPVLAPRAGGVVENIRDGWNGFLFAPQDREDFSQKLKLLSENSALRQEMGNNGKKGLEKYSWDRTVENLVEVWQEQIEQTNLKFK